MQKYTKLGENINIKNIEIAVKTRLEQSHEPMRNGVMKERKKPGLKKARKASQFSKR